MSLLAVGRRLGGVAVFGVVVADTRIALGAAGGQGLHRESTDVEQFRTFVDFHGKLLRQRPYANRLQCNSALALKASNLGQCVQAIVSRGLRMGLVEGRTVVLEAALPQFGDRLEAIGWSLICRALVKAGRLERAVRWLDLIPAARFTNPTVGAVALPPERYFASAGACLARTLARSQYLRRRGTSSDIAIGVRPSPTGPIAHAWLEPFDGHGEHQLLTTIER